MYAGRPMYEAIYVICVIILNMKNEEILNLSDSFLRQLPDGDCVN